MSQKIIKWLITSHLSQSRYYFLLNALASADTLTKAYEENKNQEEK